MPRKLTRKAKSSSRKPARKTGKTRKADFGIPARNLRVANIVSEKTKHRGTIEKEAGDLQPRAGVESREAGVGGREAGPGSFSGGDADPNITGVGFGGSGIAQSGPDSDDSIGAAATQ